MEATMPAGSKPSANGAASVARPTTSSTTAWVGREISRNAVIARPSLADWPVSCVTLDTERPERGAKRSVAEAGELEEDAPGVLTLLGRERRRIALGLTGDRPDPALLGRRE